VERFLVRERIAEGAPFWRSRQDVARSRFAIARAVRWLQRPAKVEPARSRLHLALSEISRGIAAGESLRCIAVRLNRSPSTVAREVTRHGWPRPLSSKRS
jgi:hypothetical protein